MAKNFESPIIALRHLHYQICNGGLCQCCINHYIDDVIEAYGSMENYTAELKNAVDLNTDEGKEAVKCAEMITKAVNNIDLEYSCGDCNGSGEVEEEVEEENDDGEIEMVSKTEECCWCNGKGTFECESYADAGFDYYVNSWEAEWDSQYYHEINSELIDNLTNQSHNHSIVLDMIEESKKQTIA